MIQNKFTIWIVSPPDYPIPHSFDEVAFALCEAFARLGFAVPVVRDPEKIKGMAIIFGAILLTRYPQIRVPKTSIIFNLEQLFAGSPWLTEDYISLLRLFPVWDYSRQNIEVLQKLGVTDITLCRIGYSPGLSVIPNNPADEDIDVLHYGSLNQRRAQVLEQLAAGGIAVKHLYGEYGTKRDRWISRSKIVLNMHFYPARVFEVVRVSFLLANKRFVISEAGGDKDLENPFRGGLVFAPYERLVDTCMNYLKREQVRQGVAEKGFRIIKSLDQTVFLEQALTTSGLLQNTYSCKE